ncbi:MAG: ATP-dependent DNA helicase [Actinobacteria bacterium]|nr:MAG: ATP-dependent DNA helicase [Actinomycetota bacterium]
MISDALARFLQPGTDPDVAASYATLAERAREAVFGFEDEIAFVDVETTGFDPWRDEIIEFAVVIARGPEIVSRYSTLVRPQRPIPKETTQLTGIDDAMVADAPVIEAVVGPLAEAIGKRDIVAHNARFDRDFLAACGCGPTRLRGAWLDSLELARVALPRLRSHRLVDLAAAFGADEGPAHRATTDTEMLARLWRVMLVALDDQPDAVLGELSRLGTGGWTLGRVFAHLAAARERPAFDLKTLRHERLRHEKATAMTDAAEVEMVTPDIEAVLAEFEDGGAVRRMYPGFEARQEQVKMADAVLSAFCSDTHLAVEAGTGVGKSVAYLVPAAHLALANHVAVGVATKTNNLMDQLLYSELPALSKALDGKLRYVALKGYDHYPCLRKFARVLGEAPEADEETRAAIAMLVTWVARSSWGDLDAVNIHWPQGLKRAVGASFADCTKKHCRYYPSLCYLHGQRRRAVQAHIVVTNHALFFRDLVADGGILPPVRHWIVDEAHAAEDEARDQLSTGVSWTECKGALSGLHAKGRGGTLDALRGRVGHEVGIVAKIDEVREVVTDASTIADSFFDFVKDLGSGSEGAYDRTQIRITPEVRESARWGSAAGVGRSLAKRLERTVKLGAEIITGLEELGEEFTEQRSDLVGQITGIASQLEGLATVLDGEDEGLVYSVTTNRRRDVTDETLSAALLDVGETLAEHLYPRVRSVVFTSATIATGDDFSHFERSVGLNRLPAGSHRTLRLASSYDFERQMAVFVPTGIAEPNARTYLDDLEKLLFGIHTAMGGSVLTLFTNRRDMDELFRRLADPLEREGLRLVVQSAGTSRKRVADEFLADERVSLFATKSFWEGFDAKGDTLRCVVVPRLPFGPVGDPLYEERRERDPRAWDHYYLPEAVLELKQAAGRLIRSSTDEGCLVLADARLVGGKPYAARFLAALPVQDIERLPAEDVVEQIRRRFGR